MDASRRTKWWTWLKSRLSARPDSEHEQALLRIVIVTVFLLWISLTYEPATDDSARSGALLLVGLGVDLLFALGLFLAICAYPDSNVVRRIIGSITDNSAATFVMLMTGEAGFLMIGVYLFVAFGNGFRYGRKFLFISQALALTGFIAVLLIHDYWKPLQTAGWSLFVALVILPVYVSTLLQRIHEAQRRAEEANLAKTSFLANMSHEMRTPLNGIVGAADLIRATPLSPQQTELIRLLFHSAKVLRSLVDDVLDISKIEAGRLTVEQSDFDLHATLNGVIHLLRPHAEAKGLLLRAIVDPAIDYTLRGDQHHLRQVLLNLISNAVKFTHRGEISIEVMLSRETEEQMEVRFEVRDTGIGIAPEAQGRIFDAFVQADDSTTRRFGGTGLGTTIAKQLVELMDGRIGLESRLEVGSLFWFEIPLKRSAEATRQLQVATDVAALLVGEANEDMLRVRGVVEQALSDVKYVEAGRAAQHLREVKASGGALPIVIVSGSVERAITVLNELRDVRLEADMPLIYVADDPTAARKSDVLARVSNLQVVGPDTSSRQLRNAIHAATSRDLEEASHDGDLVSSLRRQRVPARVLVAEDNATNLAILRHLLESAGHTVLTAVDGEQALDIFETQSPDLAILDFNMPERNGVEVVAAIRTMEPVGSRLPVVILSAAVTPEAKARAQLGGADEFVGKPFDAVQFLQTVDRLTQRRGAVRNEPAGSIRRTEGSPILIEELLNEGRLDEVARIGRTPEFLGHLLDGFRDDVDQLLRKLDAASATGQYAVVEDILHSIKGAAVSIGAVRLASHCREMEMVARRGDLSRIFELNPRVRACFDETIEALSLYGGRKDRWFPSSRYAACSTVPGES